MATPVDDFTTFLDLTDFSVDFSSLETMADVGAHDVPLGLGPLVGSSASNGGSDPLLGLDGGNEAGTTDRPTTEVLPLRQQTTTPVTSSMMEASSLELELHAPYLHHHHQQQQYQPHPQRRRQQQQQQYHRQAEYQRHLREQASRQPWVLPPTPNGSQTSGPSSGYYTPADLSTQSWRYQPSPEDQMIFTPLVSPAVTPLEAHFVMPDYTVPGAYLSPLTSPALEAQHPASHRTVYHPTNRLDTSVPSSPIDFADRTAPPTPSMVAVTSSPSVTSQPSSAKKVRRTSVSSRAPTRVVRPSPSIKGHRRIPPTTTTTTTTPRSAARSGPDLTEPVLATRTLPDDIESRCRSTSQHAHSSSSDSISPEPLADALMPPPPAPASATAGLSPPSSSSLMEGGGSATMSSSSQSPMDHHHHHLPPPSSSSSSSLQSDGVHPATPASLMRLPNGSTRSRPGRPPELKLDRRRDEGKVGPRFVDMEISSALPPAALQSPGIMAEGPDEIGQATPTWTGRAQPPSSVATSTSTSTPIGTPMTATHGPSDGRKPVVLKSAGPSPGSTSTTGGRAVKKRTNSSSVQMSPSLRPKISPSIKPLLPEGATLSVETSALLLASRSNYQNILEGNHLPGVSYPEALSTHLTSKRTSHKIAEQGRRNRINQALQEMASLVPAHFVREKNGTVNNDGGGDNVGSGGEHGHGHGSGHGHGHGPTPLNSKASTVEMAIEYIKALQRDLSETKSLLEAAEKKIIT